MNKKPIYLLIAILVLGVSSLLAGDQSEAVPTQTIMQNASKAAELSTLVSAIKAAGLEELLQGTGPYTLFAPNNEAFGELPKGTLENLMKPENKAKLKAVLEMHIVQGKWTTADLKKKLEDGKGTAELTCMTGEKLHIADHGGRMLMVKDNDDDIGMFLGSDQENSNGVVHVIDNVLSPKE